MSLKPLLLFVEVMLLHAVCRYDADDATLLTVINVITHVDIVAGVKRLMASVCLSVCLHDNSKTMIPKCSILV